MPNSDELIAIVERILNGSRDESEVAQLRQWLKVSGTTLQFVSQDGKFNTNIGQVQGGEIHIGDRIYQFDLEALRELLQPTTALPNIDWQAVSQAMLEEQLRLTTNPLTSGEGISYRTEQVYVPLGLVERKRQTRRREDVPPEQGSLLYEETEITQRFEHEQFLEQVLWQGQSPKSRGKRLAIIGEPGAGKTTLLQQIAQWVSKQGEGAIAIWVSLADLRGQELEPYLLEQWLQAVARKLAQAEASSQVKDAFVAQFQQGRVWLLLDGVDEMQVSSGNPLAEMSRQVRMGGLLSQARIVLSCRLNLWDGNHNSLDTFDTYRTLEFSYPQQVEQFVGQWFGALREGQGGQAERLCAALKVSGKERIRDLVKNPLRLTLLCFNWYLGEGTLPETKAGLYEHFVADFYEWKREHFSTTVKQQRQLNAALGELAREAIDKEATRFRLRHEFVCEFLGEPDEPDSLLGLALRLGWLNKVGVEAENPRKAVYAFFHPTFQEYFAALAIEDWHFFLNHIPENPSHPDANYRVFESQWREVFLLWLGQIDVELNSKEEFLEALVNFEEKIDYQFYKIRAYFLAGAGTLEFRDYSKTDEIIRVIVAWSFGCFESETKEWVDLFSDNYFIKLAARATLQDAPGNKVTEALERFIQDSPYQEEDYIDVAVILLNIDPENSIATNLINDILSYYKYLSKTFSNYNIFPRASGELLRKLGKKSSELIDLYISCINLGDKNARSLTFMELKHERFRDSRVTQALIDFIKNVPYQKDTAAAFSALDELGQDNVEVVNALLGIIESSQSQQKCIHALQTLSKVGVRNTIAIGTLVRLIEEPTSRAIRPRLLDTLGDISESNQETIKVLSDFIAKSDNKYDVINSAWTLWRIDKENTLIIDTFEDVIKSTDDEEIIFMATYGLGQIQRGNLVAIDTLMERIEFYYCNKNLLGKEDSDKILRLLGILAEISNYDNYNNRIINFLMTLATNTSEEILILACRALTRIDKSNCFAIQNLTKLIKIYKEKDKIPYLLKEAFKDVIEKCDIPLNDLKEVIEFTQDNHFKREIVEILWKANKFNPILLDKICQSLIENIIYLNSTEDFDLFIKITDRSQVRKIVTAVKDDHSKFCSIIWNCTQILSYQQFYQAWYS